MSEPSRIAACAVIESSELSLDEQAIAYYEECFAQFGAPGRALEHAVSAFPAKAALLSDYAAQSISFSHLPGSGSDAALESLIDAAAAKQRLAAEPFGSLGAQAKRLGIDVKALCSRCHICVSIFMKLDRRLIEVATVPSELISLLARELSTGVDTLRAYLVNPPKLAPGADYKSPSSPKAARRQTFRSAIDAATATGEITQLDRDHWLAEER